MNLPARVNYVDVEIEAISKLQTQWDNDFREPAKTKTYVATAPVVVKAQVNLGSKEFKRRVRTKVGEQTPSRGRLVFKQKDLDKLGLQLKKGDKVKKVAGRTCSFEITELRPESPLRGKFLLLYADFVERF